MYRGQKIDLDNFKMINDFEEHGVRDSILYEFVSLLETLENVVAVIRLGGDGFRIGRIEKELKETLLLSSVRRTGLAHISHPVLRIFCY